MDVRLNLDLNFSACVYYNKQFHVNNILANITVVTNTIVAEDTQIAVERLRWWVANILQDSVFINRDDTEKMGQFWGAGLNVIALPAEATDQTITMLLYSKLNAIAEGKILVVDVQLTSGLSDGVRFIYDETDDYGPFTKDEWWNYPGVDWFTKEVLKDQDGILHIKQLPSWEDINLHWSEEDETEKGNIVEVDFKKDDKR